MALFERWTALSGEPWAAALVARCHALLHDSEDHFTRALELHAQSDQPYEQARTSLAYGEWLRRRRRKAEARPLLRYAHEAFDRLGARSWADRAAAELRAAGEATLTRRRVDPGAALTPRAAGGTPSRDRSHQPRNRRASPAQPTHHRAAPFQGISEASLPRSLAGRSCLMPSSSSKFAAWLALWACCQPASGRCRGLRAPVRTGQGRRLLVR